VVLPGSLFGSKILFLALRELHAFRMQGNGKIRRKFVTKVEQVTYDLLALVTTG